MGFSYNRKTGLILDADLTLLYRRSIHRLLTVALKSKRKAHRNVLKVRCGVAQTRVWREMQSCSDLHLKSAFNLWREVRVIAEPWPSRWSEVCVWGLVFNNFLDRIQNSLQSFWNSAVDWDAFRNTLYFRLISVSPWLDWQYFEMPRAWSCLDFGFRECTIELLEASREDRHECLRNSV